MYLFGYSTMVRKHKGKYRSPGFGEQDEPANPIKSSH